MSVSIFLYTRLSICLSVCLSLCVYVCVCICVYVRAYACVCVCQYMSQHRLATGWQRPIGCLISWVAFRKLAINYRALLRKLIYKDKVFCGSSPPCINELIGVMGDVSSRCCQLCHLFVTNLCHELMSRTHVTNSTCSRL